eukprot:scaffold869_cov105-Isochrysis_galbana.AAC.23
MPPLKVSLSPLCFRKALSTSSSGCSSERDWTATRMACELRSPSSELHDRSTAAPDFLSVNLRMGTLAWMRSGDFFPSCSLAFCIALLTLRNDEDGLARLLPGRCMTTMSKSEPGSAIPVEVEPNWETNAPGSADCTTSLVRVKASARKRCSRSVGCTILAKCKICRCSCDLPQLPRLPAVSMSAPPSAASPLPPPLPPPLPLEHGAWQRNRRPCLGPRRAAQERKTSMDVRQHLSGAKSTCGGPRHVFT